MISAGLYPITCVYLLSESKTADNRPAASPKAENTNAMRGIPGARILEELGKSTIIEIIVSHRMHNPRHTKNNLNANISIASTADKTKANAVIIRAIHRMFTAFFDLNTVFSLKVKAIPEYVRNDMINGFESVSFVIWNRHIERIFYGHDDVYLV